MRTLKLTSVIFGISLLSNSYAAPQKPPTQVVYRFDEHRYLELTGYNCQGALWYTDAKLKIHTEVLDRFYQIFTKPYIHPSEKYIAILGFGGDGFFISKDYGRTFGSARYVPGGGAKSGGASKPQREEYKSFTVVNDQGFVLTTAGDIYLSSKPFDEPDTPGGKWGKDYISLRAVQDKRPDYVNVLSRRKNFQELSQTVPEIKNYTGWDHMRCDPDLGMSASQK